MTPPVSQQSALQKQIDDLGVRMDRGFEELKQIMTGMEGRVRGIETREAGCQPIITSRMDAAWKMIDEHDMEIKRMNDAILELKQTNRLLTWLGGIVGSTLLIWLATQLLGLIR